MAKKSTFSLNAIVIHMHRVTTEKNVINVKASQSLRPDDKDSLMGKPELLGIALTLYKAYQEAWSCPYSVKDCRYQMHGSSLAT